MMSTPGGMGSTNSAPAKNYAILRHTTNLVVVQVNPEAYTASVVVKDYPKGYIAFNTNYSWLGVPIGHLKDGEKRFGTLPSRGTRPILKVGKVECEVGPTLVKDGKDYTTKGIKESKLRDDATRSAQRVAVGFTEAGKLIIVYGSLITLKGMAAILISYKVKEGYAMDGGSSAYLKIGSLVRGYPKPHVAVSLSRS